MNVWTNFHTMIQLLCNKYTYWHTGAHNDGSAKCIVWPISAAVCIVRTWCVIGGNTRYFYDSECDMILVIAVVVSSRPFQFPRPVWWNQIHCALIEVKVMNSFILLILDRYWLRSCLGPSCSWASLSLPVPLHLAQRSRPAEEPLQAQILPPVWWGAGAGSVPSADTRHCWVFLFHECIHEVQPSLPGMPSLYIFFLVHPCMNLVAMKTLHSLSRLSSFPRQNQALPHALPTASCSWWVP